MTLSERELEAIRTSITDHMHLLYKYKSNEYRLLSEAQMEDRIIFLNTLRIKIQKELKDKK